MLGVLLENDLFVVREKPLGFGIVTIEIDDDIVLEAGTVQELMKRYRAFSEQSSHRTGEGFSSKMKLFMSELNKMVDCPVCLSVPTKTPVFMCTNRHNIC